MRIGEVIKMATIAFHKYTYPFRPKCHVCMKEGAGKLIHVERTYNGSPSTICSDSLYFCYSCIDDMQEAKLS